MTTTNGQATETRFVYFIGIQYVPAGGNLGFLNLELPLSQQIQSIQDVALVEGFLRSRGYPNAIVMGFQVLRTETVAAVAR